MENPFEQRKAKKGPKATRLLEIDAWIDSTLYEGGFKASEIWENLTIFFRRFRVSGWRRAIIELLSEGATMGAAGSVIMLALALPAFDETSTDWRNQGDFAVTFLDRYGNEIGQRGIIQRDSVPVDEMPDHVIDAVLATEDRRFFEHFGIDFLGLFRAMSENVRANSVVQGGSTITQQLAKNLFLSNERTVERKVKEAFLSVWLEMNLSKKEILQLYLDRAYMGGGTFGVAAAADFYFGKNIKDLTLAEAAMLAGLFKAPTKYAPHINLPAARARANEVLTNMVQGGFLTEGQVLSARLHPADVDRPRRPQEPRLFPRLRLRGGQARRRQIRHPFDGRAHHHRPRPAAGGRRVARIPSAPVRQGLRRHRGRHRHAGEQRRRAGDRRRPRLWRQPVQPRHQGAAADRIVVQDLYLHGGDGEGLTPDTAISDGPISWGNWSPKNYGRGYAGRVTLTTALIKSINTVPVRLAKDYLSIPVIKAEAIAMGVESPLEDHKTMVLGTSGMTVMDQATGYNTLADGGFAGTRHAITQLMTRSGEVFFDYRSRRLRSRRAWFRKRRCRR